jgi:membrane protein DedA with SNARE-associated domain
VSSVVDSILHLHGPVALLLLFAFPCGESAIFLGFVFPGETAAVIGGVLAFEHRVSLAAAIAVVIAGAFIGDSIGYEVGRRWGTKLLSGPLSRWIKPHHVARAEGLLRRRGGWAVLIGRFTAALRVLMPGIAGTGRMPYRRFAAFNLSGAIAWGAAYVLLGFLAGASWRHVASVASTAGLVAVAVVVAAAVVTFLVLRRRREAAAVRREAEAGSGGDVPI